MKYFHGKQQKRIYNMLIKILESVTKTPNRNKIAIFTRLHSGLENMFEKKNACSSNQRHFHSLYSNSYYFTKLEKLHFLQAQCVLGAKK